MIYEIHPQKIYKTNIDKDESFHLETLNEAIRTMDNTYHHSPFVYRDMDMETAEKKYTSPQKRFWTDSPTYSREFDNSAFKEIFDFINKCVNEYLLKLRIDPNIYQVEMTNAYLNRCDEESGEQLPHNHRGALISYSYYLHLKGEVQPLIFGSPTQSDAYFFPFELCTGRRTEGILPSIGDVIMFPSYLLHTIPSPKIGDERLLFNVDFHVVSDALPNLPNQT